MLAVAGVADPAAKRDHHHRFAAVSDTRLQQRGWSSRDSWFSKKKAKFLHNPLAEFHAVRD
jgi:hypothetical protein